MILFGRPRSSPWFALLLALLCAVGGWVYGLKIASPGLNSVGKWILPFSDLVPVWCGAREALLHHGSPYTAQVAAQAQLAMYGRLAPPQIDQQYFIYPLLSVFLFAPFALLPLAAAKLLALAAFLALTVLSVGWWTGRWSPRFLLLASLLALASFPCFYALILLQPTALFAPLLAAAYAAARRGWLPLSGVLLALACAKPQLAAGLILALLLWSCADLRRRRALPAAFLAALAVLLAAAEALSPGWIPAWLHLLKFYSAYTPLSSMLFLWGRAPGIAFTVVLVAAVLCALWRNRNDLPFASALCIGATLLAGPIHVYDLYLLLAPTLWLFANRAAFADWAGSRLLLLLELSLVLGWLFQAALTVFYLFSPRAAVLLWGLPFGLCRVLPFTVFLPLLYRAFWLAPAAEPEGA